MSGAPRVESSATVAKPTKKYLVFHDYGHVEGWKIVAESDSMLEAVLAREADISGGGGTSMIFEAIPVLEAYRRAEYERDRRLREKQGA